MDWRILENEAMSRVNLSNSRCPN